MSRSTDIDISHFLLHATGIKTARGFIAFDAPVDVSDLLAINPETGELTVMFTPADILSRVPGIDLCPEDTDAEIEYALYRRHQSFAKPRVASGGTVGAKDKSRKREWPKPRNTLDGFVSKYPKKP